MKVKRCWFLNISAIIVTHIFIPLYSFPCNVPGGIAIDSITTSSVAISWSVVPLAVGYNIQYRIQGTSSWSITNAATNYKILTSLHAGTPYEIQIQSICAADSSQFSLSESFATLIPPPDHIVICVMENKGFYQIIDTSAAPYINSIINDSGTALFMHSFAIVHPSFPNYLDLYSGSNQGIITDTCFLDSFTTPNLGSQLIAAGKSFTIYCEDLPYAGYNGCATGNYLKRHNPSVYWQGTDTNQIPPAANQPFSAFPPSSLYSSLPTVSFVIPNKFNDMHSGTIEDGDAWLQDNMSEYIEWAKTNNSLFIFTFDEDDFTPKNHIPTFFTGAMIKSGKYYTPINHFSVLRTVEAMYQLQYIGNADAANTILGCWKNMDSTFTSSENEIPVLFNHETMTILKSFPNPVTDEFSVSLRLAKAGPVTLEVINVFGKRLAVLLKNTLPSETNHSFVFSSKNLSLRPGSYFLKLSTSEEMIQQKLIIQ